MTGFAMDASTNMLIMLSLIGQLLVTSEVSAQRSRGSSSLSRLSRMTSGLSALSGQQDMFSLAGSNRARGSLSNSLLAELVGYRPRSSLSNPDASYLRNSLRSGNLVSQGGDMGSRFGLPNSSRGYSDYASNFGRRYDRGLGFNSLSRLSPFNRYDTLRNSVKDSFGLDFTSGLSSLGGGGGGGFDLGGSGGNLLADRLASLSQFDLNNKQPFSPSSMLGSAQGLNSGTGSASNIVGGVVTSNQPATTIVRNQAVQQIVKQPTSTFVGVAAQPSSTSYASIPTANIVSTIVQPAANVVPVVQQAATSNIVPLVQQASVMVQQAPRVLPVVSVATQPVQTMVQTLPHSSTLNFGSFRSLGGGLNRGLFSNMQPVIVKMEDMPGLQKSSHEVPMNNPLHKHGRRQDPISVVKLDEGLSIVVNYSDPYGTIMNLPAPTNEEEATLLKKVLEKAEAPEYLKSMIRIRPQTQPPAANIVHHGVPAAVAVHHRVPAVSQPVPAAVAVAPAPAVPVAPVPIAPAAAAAAALPSAAVVAPAPAAAVPAAHVVASSAAAAAVAAVPAATGPHAMSRVVAPGMFAAYDDMSIDEIIAGTFIPTAAAGGAGVAVAASYPVDHRTANGRFMLTALDMELTQEQYAALQSPTPVVGGRKKRKALTSFRSRWPGGVIPFEIQGAGFSPADHQQILNTMGQWSSSTCINFRPATPADVNRLVFREGKGCSSNVGMIGGAQYLTLQKECRIPKILAHEIGHAVGLIHEHQRDDRDNYIYINYHNIKPGTEKDFDQFKAGSIDHSIAGYDYMSIMHYGKTAFARDKSLVTMQAVDPKFTNLMGTAKTLSPSDYHTVNVMYGCAGAGAAGGMMAAPAAAAAVPVAPAAAPVVPAVQPVASGTQPLAAAPAQPIVMAPAAAAPAAAAQASTDPCFEYAKYCNVEHDIAITVLGASLVNRCSHLCSGRRPGR